MEIEQLHFDVEDQQEKINLISSKLKELRKKTGEPEDKLDSLSKLEGTVNQPESLTRRLTELTKELDNARYKFF